ncbi:MAG: FAD-dependent monooxygenase, partial [Casimicrobiaceae bacterium]
RVLGDRIGTQLDFSAFDAGERALAWLVEQQALMTATLAAWTAGDVETIHVESPPETLSRKADRIAVGLADGRVLAAKLLVGADGLQSWVREQSGIHSERRSYGQSAVVANFQTERPHHGRAWQWFRPDGGVLAWLPLPGRRMSMVWSSPQPAADELLGLDDAAFAAAVEGAGGQALGQLSLITPRASFPLSFVRPASPIGNRIALIGDAAHGVHPLAGQGLNLGYADVGALAAVLRDRGPIGDPGSGLLLGRYARERAWPTRSMQAVTDGLWRLFNAEDPVSATFRNRGMSVLNRFPAVKAILMQPAMR